MSTGHGQEQDESTASTTIESDTTRVNYHSVENGTKLVPSDSTGKEVSRTRGLVIGICLGSLILVQAINISMMTTVSSAIVKDLDAYTSASWLTSSYLIAMSSLTPVGGRLCRIFSTEACILFASIVFSIGSVISASAPNLTWFLVGRIVSGSGAAFVFGVATVFVVDMVSSKRRGMFVGLINTGYTVGVASGAVIAGALEASLGWRSIFWLELPFLIPAGLGIFYLAPRSPSNTGRATQSFLQGMMRVDYLGVVTLTSSLVLLLYSVSASKINYVTLVTSIVIFVAFLVVEARLAKEPIIPFGVIESRPIALSCLATLLYMISRWTVLFYTPVFSIAVRGWSTASAGLILIPTNGGFAIGGVLVGLFHIRSAGSYYIPTLLVFLLFTVTLYVFSQISTPHPTPGTYIVTTFCNGLVTGATLNYGYAHVLHISPLKTHSIVTSLVALSRGFSGSFGSAVGGGIYGRILQRNLETGFEGLNIAGKGELIKKLIGSPVLARDLEDPVQREVARNAYASATKGLFLAASGLSILAILAQAGTGWRKADGDEDEDEEERPLLPSEE